MSESDEGSVLPLPIDPQIVSQQAQSTIKSMVDAVVELLTNCDDSYRRMELARSVPEGDVSIQVIREKGGTCPFLEITDHAEGWIGPRLNVRSPLPLPLAASSRAEQCAVFSGGD